MGRRAVLGFGVAGVLGAVSSCSRWTLPLAVDPRYGSPETSTTGSTSMPSAAPTPTPDGTDAAPHVTSTPSGSLPTRQDILDRFGSRKPGAWALNLPGEVTSVPAAGRSLALTFDACGGQGGNGYDEKLIELLRARKVRATLLFNARWITANPTVAQELATDPLFRIGNHGTRHQPLSTTGRSAYGIKGTESLGALYDEVISAHDWIAHHCPGKTIHFRSGTAFSDDIGVEVCRALGMPFVGFTLNGDGGTTFTPTQVTAALATARPGDVVISHMNHPERGTRGGYVEALPELLDAGFTFRHLTAA